MIFAIRKRIAAVMQCRRGATAVEYALICALVCLAAVGAINGVAGSSSSLWGQINNRVASAGPSQ